MFLTGSLIVGSSTATAAPACRVTLESAAQWRPVPDDLFMAFRSNAAHFWSWLKQQKAEILQATGLVIGDAHILNFRDVILENGQRELTATDVDDAGLGSLVGDFLRFYIGNQISPYQVHGSKLIAAYIDGLNSKKIDKPSFIKDLEDKNTSKDDIQKWIKKYIDKDKFSAKAAVTAINQTTAEVQALYKKWEPTFIEKLGSVEILDQGYKAHEDGGSQGLARFWFLVKEKNEFRVIEFKQETLPATSEFGPQPPIRSDMLTDFSAIYRPHKSVMGIFEFVSKGQETFLARDRLPAELDFDPTKLDNKKIEQAQEMTYYIANRMGEAHLGQEAGEKLRHILETNPAALQSISDFADVYIQLMKTENK
jgi:hypothetical protein